MRYSNRSETPAVNNGTDSLSDSSTRETALNFVPLSVQSFPIVVYRRPVAEGDTRDSFPNCRQRKLPGAGQHTEDDYSDWWVSPERFQEAAQFETDSTTNPLVTLDVLSHVLRGRLRVAVGERRIVDEHGIPGRLAIVVAEHQEGLETIWLKPYRLKVSGELGFLIDYWFKTPSNSRPSKRTLQLSLALDGQGRRNKNFYLDRYRKIEKFLGETVCDVFPLTIGETEIDVKRNLRTLPVLFARSPKLVFRSSQSGGGSFGGLQKYGPLQEAPDTAQLFFLYRRCDHSLSQDLFRALRGDSFSTFSGMNTMFGLSLNRDRVSGIAVDSYTPDGIRPALNQIQQRTGAHNSVPVMLVPFQQGDMDDNATEDYYRLKHAMLTAGFASQFVSIKRLIDRNALKWSVSNIALQIFAKMGGQPWKVKTTESDMLIVGLGQSTRKGDNGVDRFLAYSVLTDSSGLYRELRFLGTSDNEHDYRRQIATNLTRLFQEYQEEYSRFVVHASFTIRWRELNAIKDAIESIATDREVFVVRFNEDTQYFGWNVKSNSMVPYKGSMCRLNREEYLVWFDGVTRERPRIGKVDRPIHVKFTYPRRGIDDADRRTLLESSVRLSGGNWRGFNAQSLPVSVAYAHRVARFLRGFDEIGLVAPEELPPVPWFL